MPTLMLARLQIFTKQMPALLPKSLLRNARFWQYTLSIFFLSTALFFLHAERAELLQLPATIQAARTSWLAIGLGLTFLFVIVQSIMYGYSFRAMGARIRFSTGLLLYLKRNLIAVFLPAGNFTSIAFFNEEVQRRDGVDKAQTVGASLIHGIASFVSIAVVAVPVLALLLSKGGFTLSIGLAFLALAALVGGMLWLFFDALRGGPAAGWISKRLPALQKTLLALQNEPINWRAFHAVWLWSCLIELIGIAHLYVCMQAVAGHADWSTAAIGYVVVLLWLSISPVLRGLGAVEVSLALVLNNYGFTMVEAVTITLLFRVFEFWSVLTMGALVIMSRVEALVWRIVTPVFIFALGVVNVISAVTPALPERMHLLRDFLPLATIHTSNFMVLTAGMVLMLTAVYLLRGLLAAWWVAVALTVLSIVGHLTKGIDFEEAIVGALALFALLRTKDQYFIRLDRRRGQVGLLVFSGTLITAFLYGTLGFYFLDKRMFGYDFTWELSAWYTLKYLCLFDSPEIHSVKPFGEHFLASISFAGMMGALVGIYHLLLPHIVHPLHVESDLLEAEDLVKRYGRSSLDYYKTYFDKLIFFSADRQAFVAYKIAHNYAVVLEIPVARNQSALEKTLHEFEQFCRESGLRPLYYRVPEQQLTAFKSLKKKTLLIGQEAVAEVAAFTLEGKSAKVWRNALHRAEKEGVTLRVYEAPVHLGILQKLKCISDQWLSEGRREIGFSSGVFQLEELGEQTILTVENAEDQVMAFLNLIPTPVAGEATYDLLRRQPDTPGWAMDFLMASLFSYLKTKGYHTLNLGLAPMTGLDRARSLPERALKFAYQRIKFFAHYHGLRAFKEKFATDWQNQYLVYNSDSDLVAAASVMAEVEKV